MNVQLAEKAKNVVASQSVNPVNLQAAKKRMALLDNEQSGYSIVATVEKLYS